MTKYGLIFISLIFTDFAVSYTQAQTQTRRKPSRIFMLDNSEILLATANDISKFEVLDSSQFVVTYDFLEIRNVDTKKPLANIMKLQVGTQFTKFYSEKTNILDSLFTEDLLSGEKAIPSYVTIGYEIFVDRVNSALRENNRMPFGQLNKAVIFYQEPNPQLKWNITEQTDSVVGYHCIKATTTFGGRDWVAWFTLDIPVSAGPWKLSGLPGLILRAEDSEQHFIYSCIGIQNQFKPIKLYSAKYKETTKAEWLDLYKRMHKTPMPYLDPEGTTDFLMMSRDASKRGLLDKTWTIPYNPIER